MSKERWLIIIGIVVALAVVLPVLFCVVLANHAPAITRLELEAERVLPRGNCRIVCNATDPDGDELSYGWSATAGTLAGAGATVTWTAPEALGACNVTVIVFDGRGSGTKQQVTIEVRANRAPNINSLVASADWTLPSGSLNVTCTASDQDGDELTYEWTVTGGVVSGTGPAVRWSAPQERGVYWITVVVKDGHGRSDTRTLPVSVVTGEPPSIEDLVITADHCYLRTNTSPYKVGQGKEYHIRCIVEGEATQLSYEWSCTAGATAGQGSEITWTAPNVAGKVTITVVVSDAAGNKGFKYLVVEVASCSPCTFPGCSG